ncbi:MAG: mannose-1-phosphate guanylyltransferase, partial [Actinobacteria bacterium]|nr:mannose-1-phosphate guanylyltransferase [Actinomycetota bacterium]NIU68835.1 mannose-1-phosphate guanylyltransferase [Actinomycetota bacterium]NIW30684.1 mannose-1-phosphate guanylyltransferase [Actinomycetota bacterium]NIX23092.1 mannose-1-phosphate guanylyltransferase [Actinomycetota bacterium]
DRSLLARTVDRAGFADATVVLTRPAFADRVREEAPDADVLVEPEARDTGPALAYAAHELRRAYDDPVLLSLPSDHHVEGAFEPVAREAASLAADTGELVAIGVEPDRPATGYGYLVPGEPIGDSGVRVESFVEKPDAERAAALLDAGALWNAGMFAWTPRVFLREARGSPLGELVDALEAGDAEAGFAAVEPVSVDRAVLERSDRVAAVRAGFEWDDLGAWDAVERVLGGELAEGLEVDASGNLLASDGAHVTVVGADDLVVAAYGDRVLVVPKAEAESVREAVAELREGG